MLKGQRIPRARSTRCGQGVTRSSLSKVDKASIELVMAAVARERAWLGGCEIMYRRLPAVVHFRSRSHPPLSPVHSKRIRGISCIRYLPPLSPVMNSFTDTQHFAHLLSDSETTKTASLSGSTRGDLNQLSLPPEPGPFLLSLLVP